MSKSLAMIEGYTVISNSFTMGSTDMITLQCSELSKFDVGSFSSIYFMTLSLNLSGPFSLVHNGGDNTELCPRTAAEHNFWPIVKDSGKERGLHTSSGVWRTEAFCIELSVRVFLRVFYL